MEGIFPENKSTREEVKSTEALEQYRDYLKELTGRLGAQFIDYRFDSGSWIMKVPHFTRYGLLPTDGAVISDEKNTKIQSDIAKDIFSIKRANTTLKTQTFTKFPSMTSSISEVSSSGNFPRLNLDHLSDMENEPAVANVQNYLQRIERLKSKTEMALGQSNDMVVSADLGKTPTLERPVKTHKELVQPHIVTVRRPKRPQWPVTHPPGFSAKMKTTCFSSEETARDNGYYMRGRRCSFVPCVEGNRIIIHCTNKEQSNVHVVVVGCKDNRPTTVDDANDRFLRRCIKVLNENDCSTNIFAELMNCCMSDCQNVPLANCCHKIFSLCSALWSKHTDHERAKKSLLDWLGSGLAPKNGCINTDLLFGRRSDALRAIANESPRLAMVLAQANGNPASLELLLEQMTQWDESGILSRYMKGDPTTCHLIALASNCPFWSGKDKNTSIQLFGKQQVKYGWRYALAAQLRYGPIALPSVPLAEALREFDNFQKEFSENYSPHALAPNSKTKGLDTAAYNLLLLYSHDDVQSIGECLLNAAAALQQSCSDDTKILTTQMCEWALSGQGDAIAWLLLRAFTIARCCKFEERGYSNALHRTTMATAIRAASKCKNNSNEMRAIIEATAKSLNKPNDQISKLLSHLVSYVQ